MTEQEQQQLGQEPPYPLSAEAVPAGEVGVVAVFADERAALGCAQALEDRGVSVIWEPLGAEAGEPHAKEASDQVSGRASDQTKDRPMGGPVVLGATIGATVGFLAASYLVPTVGAAFATGSLLTTLAGAGLGTFFGSMAQIGAAGAGGRTQQSRVRLTVRARPEEADAVRQLIQRWNPLEVRER